MNKILKIFKFTALILTSAVLLTFCSCSDPVPEKADIQTTLTVKTGFSGTRVIKCRFPSANFSDGLSQSNLNSIIENNCPSALTYSRDENDPLLYTFTLGFSSASDYSEKIEELLGTPPSISFANPSNVLTTGWRIEESFQSSQLISWIQSAANTSRYENFDYLTTESSTTVTYNDETVTSLPVVKVNRLNGYPIAKIAIKTVNKKPLFDRTVEITIAQSTYDAIREEIKEYFSSVTDRSASVDWLLDGKNYIYKAEFTNITLKQLEGFTNRLLGSVYGDAEYLDKTIGSSPLASQNSYTETLDFSNYVSTNNSNVPTEYTYSVSDKSELGSCMIYIDSKWEQAKDLLPTNSDGKLSAISSSVPLLTVQINDGIQYVAKSIDISLTALDGENLQKTYSFCYDLSNDGYEASAYTQSFFSTLGITSEVTSKDNISMCTIKFTGTPTELNSTITDVFGESNLINFTTEIPSMTLRTTKSISDHIDISQFLIGKNTDTPVTYTVISNNNDIIKNMKYAETAAASVSASNPEVITNDDGSKTVSIIDGRGDITADISVPNISDIIVCITISVIIILISITAILILRTRRNSSPFIESGNTPPKIKNSNENKTEPKKLKS